MELVIRLEGRKEGRKEDLYTATRIDRQMDERKEGRRKVGRNHPNE